VSRFVRRALAAALGLSVASCAVGNFIAGAPSTHERTASAGLLAHRCGSCHEIPDPNAMTGKQWQDALERMHRRMQLPDSEWDSLAAMGRMD
jgi:hypothetical protein